MTANRKIERIVFTATGERRRGCDLSDYWENAVGSMTHGPSREIHDIYTREVFYAPQESAGEPDRVATNKKRCWYCSETLTTLVTERGTGKERRTQCISHRACLSRVKDRLTAEIAARERAETAGRKAVWALWKRVLSIFSDPDGSQTTHLEDLLVVKQEAVKLCDSLCPTLEAPDGG